MITLVYNLTKPEQGGVGRYSYELLRRLRKKTKLNEIDLSPSFGNNKFEKLTSILWRRKGFIYNNLDKFGDINHFLNTEIFHYFKNYGKMVVTVHNPPPFTKAVSNMYSGYYSFVRSLLFLSRYKEAINKADFLIANSQITKDGIIEFGFDEDKMKVIVLGIDEKFKVLQNIKRTNVIGYIGSFTHHKRVSKLLCDWKENFTKLKNYRLYLYGTGGEELEYIRNKYDNKFSVKFLGRLSERRIVSVLNSLKAFVFPTKGESFGLPIIEAIACGNPVFIYNDAKITPEVRKYCTEVDSISEIPLILENIKIKEIVKKSLEVKKIFNWDRNVKETLKIYRELS